MTEKAPRLKKYNSNSFSKIIHTFLAYSVASLPKQNSTKD